jgi:hypothetical protein
MDNPQNRDITGRNPDGTFAPGVSGNPGGRPKNTLKNYLARKFDEMTDEQKDAWLLEHKVPGDVQWKMAEGNPAQDNTLSNPDGSPFVLQLMKYADDTDSLPVPPEDVSA